MGGRCDTTLRGILVIISYALSCLTLLHSERPKLLAFLSAIGLNTIFSSPEGKFRKSNCCHLGVGLNNILFKYNLYIHK